MPSRTLRRSAASVAEPRVSRLEAPARSDIDIWGLPRGAHKLSAEAVAESQRARLLYGLVHSIADKGYVATTLADICATARLSRSTFYAQFADKQACFLAAFRAAHDELVAAVVASQDFGSGWAARMRDSLRAYLAYNRDNPAVARAFLVESHAAGIAAWELRDWGHAQFARMQRALYEVRRDEQPRLPELPDEIFLAVVTAIEEMVCAYVRKDRTAQVMELLPRALFLLESVYSGNPAAVRALRTPLA